MQTSSANKSRRAETPRHTTSIKSFIVAVDTDYYASLNEDELTAFASELLIWEQ